MSKISQERLDSNDLKFEWKVLIAVEFVFRLPFGIQKFQFINPYWDTAASKMSPNVEVQKMSNTKII